MAMTDEEKEKWIAAYPQFECKYYIPDFEFAAHYKFDACCRDKDDYRFCEGKCKFFKRE